MAILDQPQRYQPAKASLHVRSGRGWKFKSDCHWFAHVKLMPAKRPTVPPGMRPPEWPAPSTSYRWPERLGWPDERLRPLANAAELAPIRPQSGGDEFCGSGGRERLWGRRTRARINGSRFNLLLLSLGASVASPCCQWHSAALPAKHRWRRQPDVSPAAVALAQPARPPGAGAWRRPDGQRQPSAMGLRLRRHSLFSGQTEPGRLAGFSDQRASHWLAKGRLARKRARAGWWEATRV